MKDSTDRLVYFLFFSTMLLLNIFSLSYFSEEIVDNSEKLYLINQNLEYINELNDVDKNFSIKFAGRYYPGIKNIVIYAHAQSIVENIDTSQHEIGHYLWYEKLNAQERYEYTNIFNKSNMFVSTYAETCVEEDFAETFEKYVEIETNLKNIPHDRKEFFEKYVSEHFN